MQSNFDGKWFLPMFPAVLGAIGFLWLAIGVLLNGHVHEDAYILYIFSENLAQGNGVAYFQGGPPTEGATDFLWMLLLALGAYCGGDVAVVASVLNALGMFVILLICQSMICAGNSRLVTFVLGLGMALALLKSQISVASFSGFSTAFYCAVSLLAFGLLHSKRYLYFIPLVGLLLGLIRPDGVIIGVGVSLVGFFYACQSGELKRYCFTGGVAVAIGGGYFSWRYSYFGELLPLPLYVKSHGAESLPGLEANHKWLLRNQTLVAAFVAVLVLHKDRWRILLNSTPYFILIGALSFATQSQNISSRFQAPVTTVLYAVVFMAIGTSVFAKPSGVFVRSLKAFLVLALLVLILKDNSYEFNKYRRVSNEHDYINYFPFYLSEQIDSETVVALTEAGRIAYWLPGEKYDLVGLNTRETAVSPVTVAYIEALDPDLIFVHTAYTVDFSDLCNNAYCLVSDIEMQQALSGIDFDKTRYGVKRAPLVAFQFLVAHPNEYEMYIVEHRNKLVHFYAVKIHGRIATDEFAYALQKSKEEDSALSYLQIKRLVEDALIDSKPIRGAK